MVMNTSEKTTILLENIPENKHPFNYLLEKYLGYWMAVTKDGEENLLFIENTGWVNLSYIEAGPYTILNFYSFTPLKIVTKLFDRTFLQKWCTKKA